MNIRSTAHQMIRRAFTTTLMGVVCLLLLACYDYDRIYEVKTVEYSPVKTQFSLTFSGVNPAKTRMSEEIVQGQEEPVFRGIQNVSLIAHATVPAGAVEPEGFKEWTPVLLPVNDAYPSPDSPTQFYADITVPQYTDKFLFYAEARSKGINNYHVNGCLTPNGLTTISDSWSPDDISFSLQPIYSTGSSKADLLAQYLTDIAVALGNRISTSSKADDITKQYNNIKKNKAGSSSSVLALIRQLYANLKDNGDKAAVGDAIQVNASKYDSELTGTMAIIDANGVITFNEELEGYPEDIGLPDGAALMDWKDGENKFEPVTPGSNIGLEGTEFKVAALDSYVYPPSLYYWVDSHVRTSSTIEMYHYEDWLHARQMGYVVDGVEDTDTSWKHFLDMNEYSEESFVDVYSHSVALSDEIHYGVGRLDITVKAETAVLVDAANRQVHFTSSAFPIKGILIGDQKQVDGKFEQNSSALSSIVYDTELPEGMVLSTSKTPVNSTLVLESSQDTSTPINIAVEFENNSGFDFFGYSGDENYKPIIPNGTRFYLVGHLSMDDTQSASQDRIFKQGSITHADFVVKNLRNAYNVVPDLRNPRLVLGLSANLFWQKGVKLSTEDI